MTDRHTHRHTHTDKQTQAIIRAILRIGPIKAFRNPLEKLGREQVIIGNGVMHEMAGNHHL